MPSPGDLIEALRRRQRRTLRPAPEGDDANGWGSWLASRARAVRESPFAAGGMVTVLAARAPRPPARALPALDRLAAFRVLWRQQWEPAARDQRGARRVATLLSLVLHVGFAIALLWLLTVGITRMQATDAARGESVTEVTFVGESRPTDIGGGAEAPAEVAPLPSPQTPAAVAAPLPPPPVPVLADAAQPPPAEAPEPPLPPVDAPAVAPQPLQVTEVATADNGFALPPPPVVAVPVPTVATPVVAARSREITVVEPVPPPPTRQLPVQVIAAPDLERPVAEIATREVPAPLPVMPALRAPEATMVPAPRLDAAVPALASRDVPMPAAASRPAPAAPTSAPATAPAAPAARAAAPAAAGSATAPAATTGAGPAPRPGTAAPRVGDDWSDATGARSGASAGGPPGLFNADGSPRLAGGGRVGGGLPPGTVTEDFEKIDRMGTWLKRPPTDYEPTSFDRFWVPSETLLEEWVRRSIRTVMIPIPGTTKQLRCDVALLALGGGCGISDSNLQDVEAGARPPPDVPFKPELQEGPDGAR